MQQANQGPGQGAMVIPAGTVLMREGEKGNFAYLLLDGVMSVERSGKGGVIQLGDVAATNIVGELAILNEVPRTATVTAKTDCTIVEVNKHRLKTIIRRYPEIAEIIIKVLCSRLMNLTDRLSKAGEPAPAPAPAKLSQPLPKPQMDEIEQAPRQRMATIERRK